MKNIIFPHKLISKLTAKNTPSQSGTVKIALAGVPNVGKSTVFNELTGLRRHTGNWTGKTVDCAEGSFVADGICCTVADIPGTYSLFARSAEEKEARDYIVSGGADVVLVVCDMTSPERSLPLALQILELTDKVAVFFNLSDEAKKKNISVDCKKLSSLLGVPVISGSARDGKGIKEAVRACIDVARGGNPDATVPRYPDHIEKIIGNAENGREKRRSRANELFASPAEYGFEDEEKIRDEMASVFVSLCDEMCKNTVTRKSSQRVNSERKLDRLFTGKYTAFPMMALLITFVFWLTLKGANYPSEALWTLLCGLGEYLRGALEYLNVPSAVVGFFVDGVYGVSARIVSVMLPPMAIFFPLFTLLEDFGYLPRVAFNLDRCYKKCGGCGKQALCMCMGLGCNAVGISGCRIIDSKRERLIAIFTNSFVPCNGRFPTLITLISAFLIPATGVLSGIASAAAMTAVMAFSVAATLLASKILSKTVLKGTPSSFTLELPPYRPPKILKTITRSVVDRTLKVLGRAAVVAAPAGAVIWILANLDIGGASILSHITSALDPIGKLMGLDGTMLASFILALPANEIVLPVALMSYLSTSTVSDAGGALVGEILIANGWTVKTAVCAVVFTLFHWPCSTSLLTVKKETGSIKYMLFAAFLPTAFGFILCCLINFIWEAVVYFL